MQLDLVASPCSLHTVYYTADDDGGHCMPPCTARRQGSHTPPTCPCACACAADCARTAPAAWGSALEAATTDAATSCCLPPWRAWTTPRAASSARPCTMVTRTLVVTAQSPSAACITGAGAATSCRVCSLPTSNQDIDVDVDGDGLALDSQQQAWQRQNRGNISTHPQAAIS
jgi:hypothetical protein